MKGIVTGLEPNIETGELGLAGAFGWIAEQGYKLVGASVLRSGKYVLFYEEVNI